MKSSNSIAQLLYEKPGPKTRKYTAIATVISLIVLAFVIFLIVRQFWITGQLDARYWDFFTRWTTWRFLFSGLAGTLKVAVVAFFITFAIGFILMLGRISNNKVLGWISTALIEISRGTPTLLFVYFFFLLAPQLGIKLPSFWRICLPVSISAAGIVAEVLRSGVNAVPKGQKEAAISLGMRPASVFLKIVFPQAFRYVIPALIAELVIVLKDTTFAYVVNYADLMQNARVLVSNYDALVSIYLVAALIYIVINYILNRISVALARKEPPQAQKITLEGEPV